MVVRGVYVEGNAQPPPGEKKLHLRIQGPTQEAVAHAKIELTKIIHEAVANLQMHGGLTTLGRYKVI